MKNLMTLTTDHAASSYGIPVLVDSEGNTFGPADILPSGESARAWVSRVGTGHGALITHTDGRCSEHAEGIIDQSGDPFDLISPTHNFAAFTR